MLDALAEVVRTGHPAAAERLWALAREHGTPVVRIAAADPLTHEVTYLWRSSGPDVTAVRLRGAPVWHEDDEVLRDPDGIAGAARLHHVAGTDVWWRTYRARGDLRATYSFVERCHGEVRDPAPDPFNPRRWPAAPSPYPPLPEFARDNEGTSYVALPDADPDLPAVHQAAARGALALHTVTSRVLGNRRRVWVWTPPVSADTEALPLLLLHDGWHWTLPGASVAQLMDHLVTTGAVPPMVVIAQESPPGGRAELACDPAFVDFLTDELLPWARDRWPVTAHAERTAIAGQSLGGLNAAFAAHRRPDVFGAVVAQSGSFWWAPSTPYGHGAGDLMRQYAEEPRPSVRFALSVGLLEGRMVGLSRHLRDVLVAGGHDVSYREFLGGHSWLSWAPDLARALPVVTAGWARATVGGALKSSDSVVSM
ncbi:enterochelin esterase [Nocardioides silvaticus]|uniref:Enterochelin esterase n=1 Tax=Nocardioides silvaticus TaxID=2201891 RepID=A0A316TCB4_9ACTN|nr:alpha/beta hydrolase-fold protein [Nocardioides silvaticus]PWN01141.1 enterochelin esterase [Nocardioides silvaticus]